MKEQEKRQEDRPGGGCAGREGTEQTGTPPRFADVPLALIDNFPEHPFRVRMDEDMRKLVESVRERGPITPVLLRGKENGRYELVSGHRRKKACELAAPTEEQLIRDARLYIEMNTKYLPEKDAAELFSAGQRVRHAVFGTGTVLETDRVKKAHVIRFEGMETPRAISFRAKLEVIG